MIEDFKRAILDGDFKKAIEYHKNISEDKIEDILVGFAYDTEDFSVYLYILDRLFEDESAFFHSVASTVMTIGYSHIAGAYYIAFKHMLRAVELEPNAYSYKEGLLFFYDIPDKILEKEDAIEIAKDILQFNPNSSTAQKIIKDA